MWLPAVEPSRQSKWSGMPASDIEAGTSSSVVSGCKCPACAARRHKLLVCEVGKLVDVDLVRGLTARIPEVLLDHERSVLGAISLRRARSTSVSYFLENWVSKASKVGSASRASGGESSIGDGRAVTAVEKIASAQTEIACQFMA